MPHRWNKWYFFESWKISFGSHCSRIIMLFLEEHLVATKKDGNHSCTACSTRRRKRFQLGYKVCSLLLALWRLPLVGQMVPRCDSPAMLKIHHTLGSSSLFIVINHQTSQRSCAESWPLPPCSLSISDPQKRMECATAEWNTHVTLWCIEESLGSHSHSTSWTYGEMAWQDTGGQILG